MNNDQHETSSVSIMPDGHLQFWKYLYDVLPGKLVVAGSFAASQMRQNIHKSTQQYNNIAVWYEEEEEHMTADLLEAIVGKQSDTIDYGVR